MQHQKRLTAARVTQPKRSHSNRGGTSAPLEEVLDRFEVRVGSAIGKGATLRFKVPGAKNETDAVKTEVKTPE